MELFPSLLDIVPQIQRLIFSPLYLPVGVGIAVLLFLALLFLRQRRGRYEILPPGYRTRAHYKSYLQALRHERRGEKILAASFYLQAGLQERAISLYREAREHARAAQLLKRAGRKLEAAQELEKAGRYAEAAVLYEQLKLFREAESAYLKAGLKDQALDLWRRIERPWELAELAMRIRDFHAFREGVQLCENPRPLIEAGGAMFRKELEEGEGALEPPDFWDPFLNELLLRGEALELWNLVREVASYLGQWQKAALACEHLERWEEAKTLYERSGDREGLARVLEKLGEVQSAARIKAEQKERHGELAEAAHLYEEAGEPQRALLLWQVLERWEDCGRIQREFGELESAANSFFKAKKFRESLELYQRLQRWEEAGRCAEALQDREQAAQYYRKAGKWADAARVMELNGNLRAAITDLQQALRIQGWDINLARHLAFLMMGSGMGEAAVPLLERIIPTHPTQSEDAELLYQLAMLLENEGRLSEAMRHYERLLVYDLNYRDVPERLRRLKTSFTRAFVSQEIPQSEPHPRSGGETQRISERYEILEELGRGGMGIVFKARDLLLDRLVALKMIRLEDVTENSRDRLLNEARVAAKLNHPNIVQIYDCAFARGFLTLAMEYVEGESLRDLLALKGPLPIPAVLVIVGQVSKALEYAHDAAVVHRDVKPANILWTPKKIAKLTDFGIARMVQDLKTTRTLVVGTPLYMAPEQITGRGVDHRADLYSLGVTFYELLTGTPPFPHGDVGYHHIHTPPPDPRSMRPELDERMVRILMKLLEKEPGQRYQSARELLQDLRSLATSSRPRSSG